jgi:hypothetical protein
MRHALGRILWIVPSLALVSLLAFLILVGAGAGTTGFGGDRLTEQRLRALPLFLNPNPADGAKPGPRRGGPDRPGRSRRGGRDDDPRPPRRRRAAPPAPHARNPAPAGRARVALALMPIAHRMGIASAEEVHGSDAAILFWQRFWEDRALDFRPAVVRRACATSGAGGLDTAP